VPATTKPPLRKDAQRNRDRIIAATRAAFQERGLDVGVDEIARRHGFAPWRRRFQGETSEGALGTERVILLKPTVIKGDREWEQDLQQARDRLQGYGQDAAAGAAR
jgi:hypothetical protein